MSKQITTRWYIGAWVVAVLVGIATGLLRWPSFRWFSSPAGS